MTNPCLNRASRACSSRWSVSARSNSSCSNIAHSPVVWIASCRFILAFESDSFGSPSAARTSPLFALPGPLSGLSPQDRGDSVVCVVEGGEAATQLLLGEYPLARHLPHSMAEIP